MPPWLRPGTGGVIEFGEMVVREGEGSCSKHLPAPPLPSGGTEVLACVCG